MRGMSNSSMFSLTCLSDCFLCHSTCFFSSLNIIRAFDVLIESSEEHRRTNSFVWVFLDKTTTMGVTIITSLLTPHRSFNAPFFVWPWWTSCACFHRQLNENRRCRSRRRRMQLSQRKEKNRDTHLEDFSFFDQLLWTLNIRYSLCLD